MRSRAEDPGLPGTDRYLSDAHVTRAQWFLFGFSRGLDPSLALPLAPFPSRLLNEYPEAKPQSVALGGLTMGFN